MDVEATGIWPANGGSAIKAFCDLTFDKQLVVKGFRVMDGKKGTFVSPPREVGKDGRWYDKVYPLGEELKGKVEAAVLEAYASDSSEVSVTV